MWQTFSFFGVYIISEIEESYLHLATKLKHIYYEPQLRFHLSAAYQFKIKIFDT